jgi:hypothetical protein
MKPGNRAALSLKVAQRIFRAEDILYMTERIFRAEDILYMLYI